MDLPGQTLGGSEEILTSDEIRIRRLTALEDTDVLSPIPLADTTRPPTTTQLPISNDMEEDDDDVEEDDHEMQSALTLSIQQDGNDESTVAPTVRNDTGCNTLHEDRNVCEPLDIAEFHSIMWDSYMTTDSDKNRWVDQGINTRENEGFQGAADSAVQTTRLDLLGTSHIPWGLTQAHGGPCGVLAAIQAELLRLLLFGTRDPLDYPMTMDQNPSVDSELSRDLIRNALALSIAIILARAAIMPPATEDFDIKAESISVKIVLPSSRSEYGLSWGDLQPWSVQSDTSTSETLIIYTLEADFVGCHNPKRQRTNGGNLTRDQRIVQLAHRVARFLLSTSNEAQTAPLDNFKKPGGVLLLVMSLVCSRGARLIQSEFDDPNGTKLTSQFGHCGQELMNLLLTGQAVSNIFDNTMKPSGDLTCRGIQSRPVVGYLTQLEALRYCESGGYYKSPFYPIWVVGSTSHFTVLFGDASCLKECKSDELLEKCRRAFKAVDNDENGFISRRDFDQVLHAVGVEMADHEVRTLAATLEVSGADIILWDSFWKAVSRLLMGASLQTVLQGGDDVLEGMPPLLRIDDEGANHKPVPSTAMKESDEEMATRLATEWSDSGVSRAMSSPSEALSDEELARRLQAEWDAEISGSGSVGAVSGSPTNRDFDLSDDDMPQNVGTDDLTATTVEDDIKMSGGALDFEKFGISFPLYHYNGLRGGTLTPFRVTRMTAEDAVGASIALGTSSSVGGSDFEDVVRTKWPSCIVNWLGKSPPYID